MTVTQIHRLRNALLLLPKLTRAAPPERVKRFREAPERAGAAPTRGEREAYAEEMRGDDAGPVRSEARPPFHAGRRRGTPGTVAHGGGDLGKSRGPAR